jgi:hypothetical protein
MEPHGRSSQPFRSGNALKNRRMLLSYQKSEIESRESEIGSRNAIIWGG